MEKYKKEGQMANGAVTTIITLVVGVGVAILVLVFVGSLGGQTYNLVEPDLIKLGSTNVSGEVLNLSQSTAQYLSHSSIHPGTLVIQNGTGGIIVELSNFTFNPQDAYLLLTNETYENVTLLANYTYGNTTIEHSIREGIINSFDALEQTGSYLPIIVLAVVIALVLALVLGMGAIGKGNNNDRGSAL